MSDSKENPCMIVNATDNRTNPRPLDRSIIVIFVKAISLSLLALLINVAFDDYFKCYYQPFLN